MAERASSSTALVPRVAAANDAAAPESAVRQSAMRQSRSNADFVAHLIATKGQLPQTRARRRAEPETAIAAYAALGHWPTRCGRALSRSL